MFIAPFNGPSSSFQIFQDVQAILSAFSLVLPGVNEPPTIFDPDDLLIELPSVIPTLDIILPNFSFMYNGYQAFLPITSMVLSSNSDNYIYLNETGQGDQSELNSSTYMISSTGWSNGFYGAANLSSNYNTTQSLYPISLANNDTLYMQWTAEVHTTGGIYGPCILDANNNGIVIIIDDTDISLCFMANNVVQYTQGIATLSSPLAIGKHVLNLYIQFNSYGLSPQSFNIGAGLLVDGNIYPVVSGTLPSAFMNPLALFPGFNFNWGSSNAVYVKSWNWYYKEGYSPLAWDYKPVTLGSAVPIFKPYQTPIFMVSTGASSALSVLDLTYSLNLANQMSYLEDTINQIVQAYT